MKNINTYTYTEYTDAITDKVVSISRSDGWSIPVDESNSDYQDYLKHLEDNK
jgi:hypothetical protein